MSTVCVDSGAYDIQYEYWTGVLYNIPRNAKYRLAGIR